MRVMIIAIALATALVATGCGATSATTGPSPVPTPAPVPSPTPTPGPTPRTLVSVKVSTIRTVLVVGETTAVKLVATWSDETTDDVTASGQLTSLSPSVSVSSATVHAMSAGTGAIKGEYQGQSSETSLTVFLPTAIGGRVFTQTALGNVVISGATVEVVSLGADMGLKTTTDSQGLYQLTGIKSTSIRLRFSASGFITQESNISSDHGHDVPNWNVSLVRQ